MERFGRSGGGLQDSAATAIIAIEATGRWAAITITNTSFMSSGVEREDLRVVLPSG